MKRCMILILMLALTGTVLWASGGKPDGPGTDAVTLNMMTRQDPASVGDFSQKGLYKFLLEKFNIDMQINPIADDAFKDRFQVVILSGDLPDLISGVQSTFPEINSIGQQGVIEEVSQYYDRMPALMAFFDENPGEREHIQDANGNVYQFTSGMFEPVYYYGCVVRKDMLEKVGFDVSTVETFEDYLDMFRALKEANGGEPPLQNRKGLNKMLRFGMWSIGKERRHIYYDQDNDRWDYSYIGDDAKYVVNWYQTLFAEGIYHPDAITYSDEVWEPEMATGGIWHAVLSDNVGFALSNEDKLKKAGKFPEMDFVPVPPPKYKGRQYQWPKDYLQHSTEIVVKAGLEKTKMYKIVDLVDWLYSKDGLYTNSAGIEGRDWFYHEGSFYSVFAGADGKSQYPPDAKPPVPLRTRAEADAFKTEWGPLYKFTIASRDRARWPQAVDKHFDLYIPIYSEVYKGKPVPIVNFDEMVIDEVNNLQNTLYTVSWEWIGKFLTGIEPMSKWDEFQEQLKKFGVDRYVQLWNEAYKGK